MDNIYTSVWVVINFFVPDKTTRINLLTYKIYNYEKEIIYFTFVINAFCLRG